MLGFVNGQTKISQVQRSITNFESQSANSNQEKCNDGRANDPFKLQPQ